MLNIWKQFAGGAYYLSHPVQFVRHLFRTFKWAWQRSIRGYADCDWWDTGNFLHLLIPAMLEKLSEDPHSYPYSQNAHFGSVSEWQEYLKTIVLHFRHAHEDTCPAKNEFEEAFSSAGVTTTKHPDGTISVISNASEELRKNCWERTVEIIQYRERELGKAFDMLYPVFFALWD